MKPIPTIQELFNRLTGDIQNRLNLTDDQKLVVDAMGATLAAEIKLVYLYLNCVHRN